MNCFTIFAHKSLAARIFLARFVTHDDFSAGYWTKEFEAIYGGTERAAVRSTEAHMKAGVAGGEASRARKLEYLEIVMQEIERLSDVASIMSEDRILAQAFENARKRDPSVPKTSKTQFDYEVTLRSDEPFKSRYQSVFGKNA